MSYPQPGDPHWDSRYSTPPPIPAGNPKYTQGPDFKKIAEGDPIFEDHSAALTKMVRKMQEAERAKAQMHYVFSVFKEFGIDFDITAEHLQDEDALPTVTLTIKIQDHVAFDQTRPLTEELLDKIQKGFK